MNAKTLRSAVEKNLHFITGLHRRFRIIERGKIVLTALPMLKQIFIKQKTRKRPNNDINFYIDTQNGVSQCDFE